MEQHKEITCKESFFQDNFNVDQCLSKHTQKSDLATLRRELKNYGTLLQQQMSEILKTETEAIVNLAEHLTNLNSKFDDLSIPISQLREEIRTVYDLIRNSEAVYKKMLDDIKINNTKQNHIQLQIGIIASSSYIARLIESTFEKEEYEELTMLERAVNKYSFHWNYLNELGILSPDTENVIKDVENKLVALMNKTFLQAVKNDRLDIISRCLRMYDNLSKQKEVENTYQIEVVRPAMQKLFSEYNFEKCNNDIDKIYSESLDFVNDKMKVFEKIHQDNPELGSFNFVLNSFWVEVDKQSREGLPYITAPGNPELFQKRFKSTWNFLKIIARKCGNENLLKENILFQDHIKRFNLPVYLEIRFQQIASNFENQLLIKDLYNMHASQENELSCKFKITEALWKGFKQCFHEDVYIDQLVDQFLKLSMMLLSRYLNWFDKTLMDFPILESETQEDFIINTLIDLTIVKNLVGLNTESLESIDRTVFKIVPTEIKPIIIKVFRVNGQTISKLSKKIQSNLIKLKISECSLHLQNVTAIPRLYRRTNRSIPKEASPYMTEAVKPILRLHKKIKPEIAAELNVIMDGVILQITNMYFGLVQEVLRSVCKTEESLRRLKSRSSAVNDDSVSQSDTMSDEMKIREQIKFDVAHFLQKLYSLGSTSTKETMDKLKSETS